MKRRPLVTIRMKLQNLGEKKDILLTKASEFRLINLLSSKLFHSNSMVTSAECRALTQHKSQSRKVIQCSFAHLVLLLFLVYCN